jgi:hypothetical protein
MAKKRVETAIILSGDNLFESSMGTYFLTEIFGALKLAVRASSVIHLRNNLHFILLNPFYTLHNLSL